MRRGKLRGILILLLLLLFLSGLSILLFPHLWGAFVDHEILVDAKEFLTRVEILPTEEPEDLVIVDPPAPTEPARQYPDLWEDMLTYNENVAMILEGRTPVVRTPMTDGDTTSLDKTLVPPSQFDSLLRAQMEGDGDYSLARTLASRASGGSKLTFAAPVEGIIKRHFSREDNYLGIGIQAAPNSPVTSIDDGTVVDVVTTGESGTVVSVQHFNGFISIYRNLSQVLVSKGQSLKSRQVIGYNAMPGVGDKTNPIFEMEIWSEGKAVDPEIYIVF